MEKFPERIDGTFRYVLIAARRAEQLIQGAHAKIEIPLAKPTRVAMREVSEDVIKWSYGQPVIEPAPEASEEPV